MRKVIYLFAFMALVAVKGHAQGVTIGSDIAPHSDALLELKEGENGLSSKGLLLPRMALKSTTDASPLGARVAGMMVYNTATAGTGATAVTPGLYYNDGDKWVRLPLSYTNWFYMPSIAIDMTQPAGTYTLPLYNEYKTQFSTPMVSSTDAPVALPYVNDASDIYYYVTYYDTAALTINSIDENGVMSYTIPDNSTVSDCSYINIVFMLK